MYSKLKENLYQCDSCDKVLKTEKGMSIHVKKNHVAPQAKASMAKEIENIRVTSKTIHEVIERITEVWLENGIDVNFISYPNKFEYTVSNTHNAPDCYKQNWGGSAHLPRGYPGWSGRWEGTVKIVDKERWGHSVNFSDLISPWGKGLPPVPWIKTGSGSGGDDFHYSGMLFIYDFPKMHEQFKAEGEEFKVLEKDYNKAVQDYARQYKAERSHYIQNSPMMEELSALKVSLTGVAKILSLASEQVTAHLHGEFSANYSEEVPKPTSIFINDKETQEAIKEKNTPVCPPPNLEECYAYVKKLSNKLEVYIKNNPEVMI